MTIGTPIATSVPGEPVPLVIRVSDTSSLAQIASFTYTISFGDGDTKTLSGPAVLLINHVYTKTGTFTVQVTATDKFGYTSGLATETIKVVPVAVEIDPFNSGDGAVRRGHERQRTVRFTASGKTHRRDAQRRVRRTYSTSGPSSSSAKEGPNRHRIRSEQPLLSDREPEHRQHRDRFGRRSPPMGRTDRRSGDSQRLMSEEAFAGPPATVFGNSIVDCCGDQESTDRLRCGPSGKSSVIRHTGPPTIFPSGCWMIPKGALTRASS